MNYKFEFSPFVGFKKFEITCSLSWLKEIKRIHFHEIILDDFWKKKQPHKLWFCNIKKLIINEKYCESQIIDVTIFHLAKLCKNQILRMKADVAIMLEEKK